MAQYGTIITNIGLAQIANAQITQTKVGLEYIALGDGNGAHYVPKQNQTALVHEVWRGPIAELSIDPTNSNRIIIDAVIPVTAGGFTIREIGIFDDKNNLIAIGQYPEKYKPQLSEGVSEETIIHFVIETNNADVVKLTIDPTVIIASRNYVDGKVAQVQTALTEHSEQIATTEKLGHIMPDGITIKVDPVTGVASGASTIDTSKFVLTDGTRKMENLTVGNRQASVGQNSSALGDYVEASGRATVALCSYTKAKGYAALASGDSSIASGDFSTSGNIKTEALNYASTAIGSASKMTLANATSFIATADAYVIGNGPHDQLRSNAFRVTFDGKAYGKAAYNSTGADYAEYFEWSDGNIKNEDRVGFIVTLEGDKIRKALSNDAYILGIISVNPSVIGDSHQEDWQAKYVTDEWGRIQYHYVDVEYEETISVNDEDGSHNHTVTKTRQDYVPILNPQWNNNEEYIPREKRKEWSPVGLMGKLLVRDDGTCEVNSYAKVGAEEGVLTSSNERTDMRVIERVASNIIRVFIK